MSADKSQRLHRFHTPFTGIEIPITFTFPFYYEPHSIAILAAEEVQAYLTKQTDFQHNFGLNAEQSGLVIGKMFGVLVCRDTSGEIGYLAAYSGKLANSNDHAYFVPPIFDMLTANSFFRIEEESLNSYSLRIDALESSQELESAKKDLNALRYAAENELEALKQKIKHNKRNRMLLRASDSSPDFLEKLRKESIKEQYFLKDRTTYWKDELAEKEARLTFLLNEVNILKEERKKKSGQLQQRLFENYHFLNAKKEVASLATIFSTSEEIKPPAGSGECAAPKLLQYAYENNLHPIALAEFWWGQSPQSEIRKHKNYYPACRGKCEPILGHMLQGLDVDENPLLINPAEDKQLSVVFEDDTIIIINKPAEFLSVPGKSIDDSVLSRLRVMFPEANGPLLIHRLDMSTSGILVAAKSEVAHKFIQRQFIKRTVQKRYIALLDGEVGVSQGIIDLPIRVDLEDRPRQLVCYEFGKSARTKYKVVEIANGKTRVVFIPITGRTHQLRVHAAHSMGLNIPIVGDDLYGIKSNRLYLHASFISFIHPKTREIVKFEVPADF
jgi:tRNA pseudouridine32 synthase/23S rRNA pseudouridine746 synthase